MILVSLWSDLTFSIFIFSEMPLFANVESASQRESRQAKNL